MSLKLIAFFFVFLIQIFNVHASDDRIWEPLKEGEKIHLFASGFGVDEGTLKQAQDIIKSYGYTPVVAEDLIIPQQFGFANTEEYRGNHLKRLLEDSDVKVLWAVRGGRGTSATLPYLDSLKPETDLKHKRIIGFNDITALHLWSFNQKISSIHGVNLTTNSECGTTVNGKTSASSVMGILSGEIKKLEYDLTPVNSTAQTKTSIVSKIVGGNLSLIQRSIGTPTSLRPENCILFLEDVGEEPSRFLEIITQFERSKLFMGVQAIILGDFSAGQQPEIMRSFLRLFSEWGSRMDKMEIPVFRSSRFGHGEFNDPLPLNMPTTLTTQGNEGNATLEIEII